MANHHILDNKTNNITGEDTWHALKLSDLPDGIAIHEIPLSELLHKEERLDVILPLSQILTPNTMLNELLVLIENRTSRIGVWADTSIDDDELDLLLAATKDKARTLLHALDLIVLYMPAFADGRSFSQAKYLRLQGYTGEIRVAGAYGRDQIAYLLRSGVDSFSISDDELSDDITTAFLALPSAYSGNDVNALPLFKSTV